MFFTNRSADCVDCEINVPGCDGLKVFFILIGIFFSMAGIIVLGWITLAPKYDISAASRYEISDSTFAPFTYRGSAVITPSTSVHIQISSLSSAAPTIDPV